MNNEKAEHALGSSDPGNCLDRPSGVPSKLVRLEVYNWTGENVYIRLEGITTGQFYYLTVPPTTRANWYNPKVYTVMTDYYRRTTWACGGVETSGQYRIMKNNRLNFTACNTMPCCAACGTIGSSTRTAP